MSLASNLLGEIHEGAFNADKLIATLEDEVFPQVDKINPALRQIYLSGKSPSGNSGVDQMLRGLQVELEQGILDAPSVSAAMDHALQIGPSHTSRGTSELLVLDALLVFKFISTVLKATKGKNSSIPVTISKKHSGVNDTPIEMLVHVTWALDRASKKKDPMPGQLWDQLSKIAYAMVQDARKTNFGQDRPTEVPYHHRSSIYREYFDDPTTTTFRTKFSKRKIMAVEEHSQYPVVYVNKDFTVELPINWYTSWHNSIGAWQNFARFDYRAFSKWLAEGANVFYAFDRPFKKWMWRKVHSSLMHKLATSPPDAGAIKTNYTVDHFYEFQNLIQGVHYTKPIA